MADKIGTGVGMATWNDILDRTRDGRGAADGFVVIKRVAAERSLERHDRLAFGAA